MDNFYKLIFENLPNALIVSDKNTKYIDINESFCKLIEYSREELIGQDFSFFSHPDDLEASRVLVLDAFNSDRTFYVQEKRYITKSGKITFVKIKIRIIREELTGKPEFFITEIFDIADERKRELTMRDKEATFEATFKAIPDMMFLSDPSGIYLDFKAELKSELYLPPEVFLGKNIREVLPPDLVEVFLLNMGKAYRTNELQVFEYELIINGEVNSYEGRMVLTDNNNIVTIVRNITRRKQNEREIIKAKESAEMANRAKSEFLSSMSHEIRTPLNGIVGAASLLEQLEMNREHRELVDIMVTSSGSLLQIVDDVLDFSKIESGTITLDPEPFILKDCMEEILRMFIPKVISKDLTIRYTIEPTVPEAIYCDKGRLKQILINLIGNAIKFTNEGFVLIEIINFSRQEEKHILKINVIDSGIGIPVESQEAIFNPFIQSDSSTSKKYGGSGLGLSISQKLSIALGGNLSIESKLGEGSKFSFTFECEEILDKSILETFNEKILLDSKEIDLSLKIPLRILVVDDNSMNQEIIRRILKTIGYECTAVGDGYSAVNNAKGDNYDLILMDIQMPGMDEFEATKQILDLKIQSKIFALTASATKELREKSVHIGFHEFLSKPVRLPVLKSAILKWFSK